MDLIEILNKLNENRKIVLVIGFLAVFGIGFLAGEEYKVHQIRSAFSDTFGGVDSSTSSDKTNVKISDINVNLDSISGQYSTIKISAIATPDADMSYASINYEAYNNAGVVIQDGYMSSITNPKKDQKYNIDATIFTQEFTLEDIDHIDFVMGSGKARKVLGTWKKA